MSTQPSALQGLILEGISGTGKTAVLKLLLEGKEAASAGGLSRLVLSEHHTQRVLEARQNAGMLEAADHLRLLRGHVDYLRFLAENLERNHWLHSEKKAVHFDFRFERFHLTHAVHYDWISWQDVREIDEALGQLNGKLCLLVADVEVVLQRLTQRSDKAWQAYQQSLRPAPAAFYLRMQEQYLKCFEASCMEKMVLDVSHLTIEQAAAAVGTFAVRGSRAYGAAAAPSD